VLSKEEQLEYIAARRKELTLKAQIVQSDINAYKSLMREEKQRGFKTKLRSYQTLFSWYMTGLEGLDKWQQSLQHTE
jgi:hypothetical protein